MQLPRLLKGFNIFADGLNKDGVIMTVKRPPIKFKTEDYTPGGAIADFVAVHGLEKLELELTAKGYDAELYKSVNHRIGGNLIRYQGSIHREDEDEHQALAGEARGRIVEIDHGEDKAGEGGEQTFKYVLTYWKETLNGEVITEIDLMNKKVIIGGNDYFAGMRKALGL